MQGALYPSAITAARTLLGQLARGVPNSRESKDAVNFAGAFGRLNESFSGFPGDSTFRLRRVLRYLAQYDDDVSGALRDMQVLVNPGFDFEIIGLSKTKTKKMLEELNLWEKRVFEGGFAALINNQVRELWVTGATSIEWVPERNRKGVRLAVPVQAENINIRQEDDGNHYEQINVAPQPIELHPLTYRYIPLQTEGSSPYGIPFALPAMFGLDRKFTLLDAEKRVINLMAHSALIKGTVPMPTPQELGLRSQSDPQWGDKLAAYVNQIADLIMAGSENGLYLGLKTANGPVEIDAVPLNQTGQGTKDIVLGNQHRVWNALGSPPYLRGELDTAAFAISRITYPMVQAVAGFIWAPVQLQLEHGANNHLRFQGVNALVLVHRRKPANPFRKEDAEAEAKEMETDIKGKQLFGDAWWGRASRRWDIAANDGNQAPDWWKAKPPPELDKPKEGEEEEKEGDGSEKEEEE